MHNRKKDILFLVGMLAAVVSVVLLVYAGQRLYYRQQFSPATAVLADSLPAITGFDLYDLNGAEASGGANPSNLFDEHTDPGHNRPGEPKTNPLPMAKIDIFYPPGKGYRILIDLHDQYGLSDVYFFDRAFAKDSIWLYSGDGSLRQWNPVLSFATAGTSAAWGWRRFSVHAGTRFLLLRFNSYNAVISEMALYGRIEKTLPREKLVLPAQTLPAPDLRSFAGTNVYDYVKQDLLRPFHTVRFYQQLDYFDKDTVHAYPKNVYDFDAERTRWLDSLRRQGNEAWLSIRGLPVWMEKKGMHEKDKPVTLPGMNTEDPMSYARHAAFYWQLAAVYGRQHYDNMLIHMAESPRYSGTGFLHRYENGNEEDGWWSKYYWTPVDYFAASSADYDGHEGKLGAYHGLKKADSTAQLMTSGMIQLDTGRVRTLAFLCAQLRSDRRFIWEGGVQYHYYSNASKTNMEPATRGISPEADSMRYKLSKVRAFHNKYLPGVPLILGENGYDRNQQSWQRTPLLPGHDAAQSQGIMVIRSMIAAFMAGFDGYNQYMMRSATNDENAPGPYATSGMIGGPANNVVYPAWYYWSTFINRLGDFQADSILSESGQVWIYRFKNKKNPLIKAWVLYSLEQPVKNFVFDTRKPVNTTINKVLLKDGSIEGEASTVQIRQGRATLDLDSSPTILISQFP